MNMIIITQLDFFITDLIYKLIPHNYFFDGFFSFFSIQGINTFFWIFLALIWIFIAEKKAPGIQKKDQKFILIFFLSLLTTGLLVNVILKNLIARPRPYLNQFQTNPKLILTNCPNDFSFPSGHAAIAFMAATVLSAFDKKRRYLYYFIASFVSLSRIYLGCHYFWDVFWGGLIGFLMAIFFIKLIQIDEEPQE